MFYLDRPPLQCSSMNIYLSVPLIYMASMIQGAIDKGKITINPCTAVIHVHDT